MFVHNALDLLRFEHAVIRLRFSIAMEILDRDPELGLSLLRDTHNFVVKWHAMIEDKYVFPSFGDKAKPFSNDHLLIDKYGTNSISQGRKDWIQRYVKIVLDHNLNEERELFVMPVDQGSWSKILEEIRRYPDYTRITGMRVES
ncbi:MULTISPECIES: cation-binding protein [Metallosphaera]|uniref:cation-binding protein n=1 Tax=Metallosphaera TaxID=41980 RepID=UPI001F06FC9B|nr:cation-binding protein [Metallosphaera sedula]MCH1770388.1 cation-binding protein [Metallosphaera sedula]MCP6727778.1 cation-binding protein [Metallosphaera sedula]